MSGCPPFKWRVDDTICTTGYVVLEDEEDVVIWQGVEVFGLAGVEFVAGCHRVPAQLSIVKKIPYSVGSFAAAEYTTFTSDFV